jgi:hypothetical protein
MNEAMLEEASRMRKIHRRILSGKRLESFLPIDFPDQEIFVLRGTAHPSDTPYVMDAFYREELARDKLVKTQLDKRNVAHPYYLVSGTASEISSGGFVDSEMGTPFSRADIGNVYDCLDRGMKSGTAQLVSALKQRRQDKSSPWYSPKKLVRFLKKGK